MKQTAPDENPNALTYAAVLAQLRHAYANLIAESAAWEAAQRRSFADGLIAPQIRKLEKLQQAFNDQEDDVLETFAANRRWQRRLQVAQERLLAQANNIASASQARRIIFSVFADVEKIK